MQKEIHEQPKTLADTMRGRVVLDGKPFKPVKSSAPDVIFSGHFIDPCESASLFSGSNIAAASGAEGGFELPSRIGGKKARAKEPTPAGALFSGALLGAAAAATAAPDKAAAPASAGFMEEGIPAAGESEPFIKLGGLSDHVEGILRCRRIVFIACGTSYHACLVARKTLEEFAAMPVVVELAGDFMVRTFLAALLLLLPYSFGCPSCCPWTWVISVACCSCTGRHGGCSPLAPLPPGGCGDRAPSTQRDVHFSLNRDDMVALAGALASGAQELRAGRWKWWWPDAPFAHLAPHSRASPWPAPVLAGP
jgi:hypothetical protein